MDAWMLQPNRVRDQWRTTRLPSPCHDMLIPGCLLRRTLAFDSEPLSQIALHEEES